MNSLEKHGQKLIIGAKEYVDFPALKKKKCVGKNRHRSKNFFGSLR